MLKLCDENSSKISNNFSSSLVSTEPETRLRLNCFETVKKFVPMSLINAEKPAETLRQEFLDSFKTVQ
jgi:hypothetical protein